MSDRPRESSVREVGQRNGTSDLSAARYSGAVSVARGARAERRVDPPMPPGRAGGREPGGRWPVAERSLLATVLGVPPAVAVGGAAVLTGLGVVVDLLRIGGLGTAFTAFFVAGCVLAVVWVRRRGLFGPMVAPPLLVAVAVPLVVVLAGNQKPGVGVAERLLVIGAPLVNAFPIMAWTTAVVVAVGVFRLLTQRPGADGAVNDGRAPAAARGAARKRASPRRS